MIEFEIEMNDNAFYGNNYGGAIDLNPFATGPNWQKQKLICYNRIWFNYTETGT